MSADGKALACFAAERRMAIARVGEEYIAAEEDERKDRARLTEAAELVRTLSFVRMGVTEQNADDVGVLDKALVAARHEVAARAKLWLESLSDRDTAAAELKSHTQEA